MYSITKKTWKIINKIAEEKKAEIPVNKNRIRAKCFDDELLELFKLTRMECPGEISEGDEMIVFVNENYGTMKWPWMRTVPETIRVARVTEKCIFSTSGLRYSKDSIAAKLKD